MFDMFGLGGWIRVVGFVAIAAIAVMLVMRMAPRKYRGIALIGIAAIALTVFVVLWWRDRPFAGPGFAFYEGNGATQDEICTLGPQAGQRLNLKNADCPNDEARSVVLLDVPAGTTLRVYDSPEGNLEDDWTEIVAKADIEREMVPSFEMSLDNERLRVTPHRNNGLDGKVSLIEVTDRPGPPTIALYEGNAATQNKVCELPATDGIVVNFQNHDTCDNDEARSAVLDGLPVGTVVRLFDSPDANREDDWVEILVKQPGRVQVDTFERPIDNADVRIVFHRNNGLDGKVSRLETGTGSLAATIDLYEGNNASQNLVCSLPADGTGAVRFPGSPTCDNDEARSMVLNNAPAGQIIRLFDDPAGRRIDDWTEVQVLRLTEKIQVDSFERSFETSDVRVTYHRNNGLDGKVSRLERGPGISAPLVELYEGNDARQNLVCSLPAGNDLAINFTNHGCDNDEARSLMLYNMRAGRMVRLFDSPTGSREDDWTEIEVLRDVPSYRLSTFERSFTDAQVRVSHFHNNGLDGKVSRLEIGPNNQATGILSFYEGNNGRQNKVCDVSARFQGKKNFKNDAQCDNDEARSVVLSNVPAGLRFRIFDSPSCATDDDWSEVIVRRNLARRVIASFEQSQSDPDLQVVYHRKNGLDGKVSCLAMP